MDTLKKNNDLILIEKIRNDACNKSILELIDRHKALCIKIFNKYAYLLRLKEYTYENFEEDLPIIFLQAINTFDKKRNIKFITWIGNYVKYFCLNTINHTKYAEKVSLDEFPNLNKNKESYNDNNEDLSGYVKDLLLKMKDQRIHKIFTMRYFSGKRYKWSKIANDLSLSIPTAIKLHDHGIKILKSKLSSETICDKL